MLNHTGVDHPWFQQARSDVDSPYRQYYTFSQDPETDIADGLLPMLADEGAAGYNPAEWMDPTGEETTGRYRFTLDWSNPQAPTVTVDEWDGPADDDNTAPDAESDKYLYFGDEVLKKFYDRGNGRYELITDFSSTWGFLIRTSATEWGSINGAPPRPPTAWSRACPSVWPKASRQTTSCSAAWSCGTTTPPSRPPRLPT